MKYYSIYSITITALLYLIVSFIKWDITWIADIGKWDQFERGFMIIGVLAKESFCIYIWLEYAEIGRIFTFVKYAEKN